MEKILHEASDQRQATVFLGSSLRLLLQNCSETLSASDPFSKKFIIIPSKPMQDWMLTELAKSRGVAAGITFLFFKRSVETLFPLFFEGEPLILPEELTLQLKIMEILLSLPETSLFEPLKEYLAKGSKEKKILSLSKRLATLFSSYAVYGEEQELERWLRAPENWQEALWQQCFEGKKLLKRAIKEALLKEDQKSVQVHIFGISHIPPLYLDFFEKIAAHTRVYFYQFSPCEMFWGDHLSLKERKSLIAFYKQKETTPTSIEKLEEYFEEENFLLANLGKVGRKCADLLELKNFAIHENYPPLAKTSLLKTVQHDTLYLEESPLLEKEDRSIEIHAHSTRNSEIEGLKKRVLELFSEGIPLREILVLAPDISEYEPYIKAHFGKEVPFKITDLPSNTGNRALEGFLHLLSLPKKNWSSLALLALFENPLFQKKHKITAEETTLLRKMIGRTGIFRGLKGGEGTWEGGLAKLFSWLINWREEPFIEFTDLPFLGQLASLFDALEDDLSPLSDGSTLTFREWTLFLKMLFESYFSCEEEEAQKLLRKLENLSSTEAQGSFCFDFIFPLIENECAKEKSSFNKNCLEAVTFASILPMRLIPTKAVCLLGMDQDSFPRKEKFYALDLLLNKKSDYFPSRLDFDRYLFLEALFSAEEHFILSYIGESPVDGKEIPPSLLTAELRQFIKEKYGVSLAEIKHPLSSISGKEKAPRAFFSLKNEPLAVPEENFQLTLKDLSLLARSPLRYYLNKRYGINFYNRENLSEEEPFALSLRDLSTFRKSLGRKGGEEKNLKSHKEKGLFPIGDFSLYADYALTQQNSEIKQYLKEGSREVSSLDITYEMPLKINCGGQIECLLTGTLEGVSEQGLAVFEKKSLREAILAWPALLSLHAISGKKDLGVFFARDGAFLPSFFHDPFPFFKQLTLFAFSAERCPIVIIPDWIGHIVKEDKAKLAEAIKKSFQTGPHHFPDPALLFAFESPSLLSADHLIEKYQPLLKNIYGEMIDAWF